ncbi:glycosyltransferase family 4 protein [Candidatus Fermentibacteria bacterium]|nr:glycosyltransferase family 4 protein [Candidatus Fermentibacteria bacterium]
MRVCLATGQYALPYSGVGTYARALAAGLLRLGIQVVVACPPSQCASVPGLDFLPVPFRRLPNHARWMGHAWAFSRRLRPLRDVDLVHFIDAREALWFRTRDIASVGTVHDYYFVDPGYYWRHRSRYPDWPTRLAYATIARALERVAYGKVHALIANSDATKTRVLHAYHPGGCMTTIHIGLDLAIDKGDAAGRNDSILFVGGNPYRKGLDRLVACLPYLAVPDAELWVAGTRIPSPMASLAIKNGLWPRIKRFGLVHGDALASLYRKAKVVALPGVTEAFGLVFMEAMAAGCAVVGPSDGGAGELIHDGKDGFLVPYEDDELLRGRLNELLTDDELRQHMVDAAAQTVAQFTPHRMAVQTREVYDAALNVRSPIRREGITS